ncbi:MAG: glycerol-3-phosphate dehydrogenase/oxidase [Actinobacteria bacterium]|nr:glycerol-3-phosphate dehydrogenase/oxidase [Actinomycetota bacterium]
MQSGPAPTIPPEQFSRQRGLTRLADEDFDLLVIGGGITGAGVALDAASRGLRTAIVEARDWASGTSSRSSKLVHGGLRYLSQREFRLVAQNLAERQRLLRNAPHLVKPLPFLIPMLSKDGKPAHKAVTKAYRSALWMYDLAGGARIGHRHQRIGGAEAADLAPGLRSELLASGFIYWDAWADDARLTLAIVRTAVLRFGAAAANHSPVESLVHDPAGQVTGARLAEGVESRAKAIVNATGVWADELRPETARGSIRPAKGIHIVVPGEMLPMVSAVVLPVSGDRRSIFAIPWAGRTYVGTTDTDYQGPLDDPTCTESDVDYLLRAVNSVSRRRISPDDVVGRWAGLRPLLTSAKRARTADLSRRHAVEVGPDGLVTVTGGKLTTYRAMAADTVDAAATVLGRNFGRCRTTRMPLWGQDGDPGPPAGVESERWSYLVSRFGSEAGAINELCTTDPSLARPLVTGLPYLRGEVVWSAREEMAADADDVLERRTRAALLDERGAQAARQDAESLLAKARLQP